VDNALDQIVDQAIQTTATTTTAVPGPPAWKPFPVHALPEPPREAVIEGAKALGCDPAFIAVPLLAALASAVGAVRRIQLKPGWTEPSVLWTGIVAESGTMKSPSMSYAVDPLRRLQGWTLQKYPELVKQFEQDKALYEADYGAWKRKGRSAGEPPPEKPDEPAVKRFLVDDITIEALADRLKDSPRGLLCAVDELAGWLGSFDAYRGGRGGDVAKWLSMHRADALLVDRKSGPSKTLFVPRAAVSVTGGIQPATLSRALGVEHLENGLAARLLLASPPRCSKKWSEATVSPQLLRRMDVLFGRLLALDFTNDDSDQPAPIDLTLTPQAKAAWITFYNEHAVEMASATGAHAALLSKIEGAAARLALVIHLVSAVSNDEINSTVVDEISITAGVKLAKWFAYETTRVYGLIHQSDQEREDHRLIDLIKAKGVEVTVRNLMRGSRQFRSDSEQAEQALNRLARGGYGAWFHIEPSTAGGRPRVVFRLSSNGDGDTTS